MIKVFFYLVALHRVLCAPGIPFTTYGLLAGGNLAEKRLPWNKLEPVLPDGTENLPGGSDLVEYSELPEYLPGTKNLDEKSIPDRITIEEVSAPSGSFEPPRYGYKEGSLLPGEHKPSGPSFGNGEPKNEQELPEGYFYPSPTKPAVFEGSEIKETGIFPGPNTPQVIPERFNGDKDAPSGADKFNIPPNSSVKLQDKFGQYSHGYANPDGSQIQESGHLISTDDGWEYVIAKEGSYRYYSPEGILISVEYIADENGFRILNQKFGRR